MTELPWWFWLIIIFMPAVIIALPVLIYWHKRTHDKNTPGGDTDDY